MNNGWVKVPRQLMTDKMWLHPDHVKFYLLLLMKANHDPADIYGIHLEPGQFLTSREKLADDYNGILTKRSKEYVSPLTIYSWLRLLKRNSLIGLESSSENTVVTVFGWDGNLNGLQKSNNNSTSTQQQVNSDSTSTQHKQELRDLETKETKRDKDNVREVEPTQLDGQVCEVISYLNAQAQKKYRANSKDTLRIVKARIREGVSVEQLKYVIDVKTAEWLNNPDMNKFLRPSTLFTAKHVEEYGNQKIIKPRGSYGNYGQQEEPPRTREDWLGE